MALKGIDKISAQILIPFLTHGDPVRIGPPHFLVCRKRRLNGAVLRIRLENRGPVSQQLCHDKNLSLLKSPEHRAMVTSPYERNILELDVKQ
jgi:hypothetical protein